MSDTVTESMENARHNAEHGVSQMAKRAAIVIAVLAALLAICETMAKSAQTSYLTHHVSASNVWSQYQAKAVRRTVLSESANILESLPNASDPVVAARIKAAHDGAARMRSEPGSDGMEQLSERAHAEEHKRDHQGHRHHGLELASGALQLSIVLASMGVVTGVGILLLGGGILGIAAAAWGLLAAFSIL